MGGGRRGWDRMGVFFPCLGISLVLTVRLSYEKPWAGGSLTLLFSISLVLVPFHNMAMEDLQLCQIYSLSSCQPRQRARNSALYSKVHKTLHFWEKNQACLRVRAHTLCSQTRTSALTEQDERPTCLKKRERILNFHSWDCTSTSGSSWITYPHTLRQWGNATQTRKKPAETQAGFCRICSSQFQSPRACCKLHTHIHAHVYVFTELDCRLILVSVVLYNADVHKFTSSVGTRWKMRGIKKIRGRKVATMEKRTKKASDGGICRAFSWSPICVITEAAALPAFPVPQCTSMHLFTDTPPSLYTSALPMFVSNVK